MWLVDDKNHVHCFLVMGKSWVTPLTSVTIPRLELTAAVVSSRIGSMLWKELECAQIQENFWTTVRRCWATSITTPKDSMFSLTIASRKYESRHFRTSGTTLEQNPILQISLPVLLVPKS